MWFRQRKCLPTVQYTILIVHLLYIANQQFSMKKAMNTDALSNLNKFKILAEGYLNAGKALGFKTCDLGEILGKDRTALSRNKLDPHSKTGEIALMFIRIYRSLFELMGGNTDQMQHWMHTRNLQTGGVPSEQLKTLVGLVTVMEYLDALKGKL